MFAALAHMAWTLLVMGPALVPLSTSLAWMPQTRFLLVKDAVNRLKEDTLFQSTFNGCMDEFAFLQLLNRGQESKETDDMGKHPLDITGMMIDGEGATRSPCDFASKVAAILNHALEVADPAMGNGWEFSGQYYRDLQEEWTKAKDLPPNGAELDGNLTRIFKRAEDESRYYAPLIKYAYDNYDGSGPRHLFKKVLFNAQKVVQDTLASIAALLSPYPIVIELYGSQTQYTPGDVLWVSISLMKKNTSELRDAIDIYVALSRDNGPLLFLDHGGHLQPTATPWRSGMDVHGLEGANAPLAHVVIKGNAISGHYALYSVAVIHGSNLEDATAWVSNVAHLEFRVAPFACEGITQTISNEPYMLHTTDSKDPVILKRWDMIFLGGLSDDPRVPGDEGVTDDLIPGRFNHIMVYLGRDPLGRPVVAEMTATLDFLGPMMRLAWIPERDKDPPPVFETEMEVPFFMKDLGRYTLKGARRLRPQLYARLKASEDLLLAQIDADLCAGLKYQLEYWWSGDLTDRYVYLVDDGRQGGSSCTDYWLSLFEDLAGVCIHGTRMKAKEVKDYFVHDPVGSRAKVPSSLNPFPVPIKVRDLFDMGFEVVDPPPHSFTCDNTTEIGVPLPNRAYSSPDLVPIPTWNRKQSAKHQ